MQQLYNPSWNQPPRRRPHDFCADYYHDWAVCYAAGSLNASANDFDTVQDGKVVSINPRKRICVQGACNFSLLTRVLGLERKLR